MPSLVCCEISERVKKEKKRKIEEKENSFPLSWIMWLSCVVVDNNRKFIQTHDSFLSWTTAAAARKKNSIWIIKVLVASTTTTSYMFLYEILNIKSSKNYVTTEWTLFASMNVIFSLSNWIWWKLGIRKSTERERENRKNWRRICSAFASIDAIIEINTMINLVIKALLRRTLTKSEGGTNNFFVKKERKERNKNEVFLRNSMNKRNPSIDCDDELVFLFFFW